MEQIDEIYENIIHPEWLAGGEVNQAKYKKEVLNVAILVPQIYPIAMEDILFLQLYEQLNLLDGIYAQRIFKPEEKLEQYINQNNISLFTIEQHQKLASLDVVILDISSEMEYTTCLRMLMEGGVEVWRRDRTTSPFIIACGLPTYNPKPLEAFVDVFIYSNITKNICYILQKYKELLKNKNTTKLRDILTNIENVYISGSNDVKKINTSQILPQRMQRRIVASVPTIFPEIIVPLTIGCGRGCKFCRYKGIYGASKELSCAIVCEDIDCLVHSIGKSDILLATNCYADYSAFPEVIYKIQDEKSNVKRNVKLFETKLARDNMWTLKYTNKASICVIAGSTNENLRKHIGIESSKEEILNVVNQAFMHEVNKIQLKYIFGIPNETYEDLTKCLEIAEEICKLYDSRHCMSPNEPIVEILFYPYLAYPHTELERDEINTASRLELKLRYLENLNKNKRIAIMCEDLKLHEINSMLVRADETISSVIYAVAKQEDTFDYDTWIVETKKIQYSIKEKLKKIPQEIKTPWNNIQIVT